VNRSSRRRATDELNNRLVIVEIEQRTNAECEIGHGVHVMQDEVWTEIVAKDDANRALPDGESGALVYTHLRRHSQPMIRFFPATNLT
jgi:phenylacetate-coenzyme A ligase PaaK-like adenylate-forming protein